MILRRGWFKRRPGAVPAELVLDFFAVALECDTEHGTYYVQRYGGDWEARFRPTTARPDERDVPLNARTADGPADWPTRGCAEEACRLHAHLVADLGYSVERATEMLAERTQRVTERERVPTLDYATPVAAGGKP